MSRMTVVAGSVMALGVAYVGSSWLLGHVAQQKYQTEFERVARLLGADAVEMVEVEKGLFHSRTMAVLTFERRSPASGADDEVDASDDEDSDHGDDGEDSDEPSLKGLFDDEDITDEDVEDDSEPDDSDEVTARKVVADVSPPKEEEAPRPPLKIHLVQDIRHGPFVDGRLAASVIETRLDHVEGLADEERKGLDDVKSPELRIVAGLMGDVDGRFLIPAGRVMPPAPEEGKLEWKSFTYDFRLSADRKQMSGEIDWPGLVLHIPAGKVAGTGLDNAMASESKDREGLYLEVKALAGKYEYRRNHADDWLMVPGTYAMSLDRLEARTLPREGSTSTQKVLLDMRDWKGGGRVTSSGGLLSDEAEMRGKLTVMGTTFDSMGYRARLSNIDAGSLRKVQDLAMTFQKQQKDVLEGRQLVGMPSERDAEALLRSLTSGSPTIDLQLDGSLEGKVARADIGVTIKPLPADDEEPVLMGAMRSVKARAKVQLPQAWVTLAQQKLDAVEKDEDVDCDLTCRLESLPFVRRQGDTWEVDAHYDAQHLVVNGEQLF
mgnify:CR=1 FL=1